MKPESGLFLQKGRTCLAKAEKMLPSWPDEAGRLAYLAGFHAAQALIFERETRVSKTHYGVHTVFSRLIPAELGYPPELRDFCPEPIR